MPKLTEWTSGGAPVRIETPQLPGESNTAWQQRHEDAVAAAQLIWPED